MIVFKCPQCGEQIKIDEKVTDRATCATCGYVATIEKDAPKKHDELQQKKASTAKEFKAITEAYAETGDAKDIHTAVERFGQYNATPDFVDVWWVFILDATGASEARKDKELQTYLKNHAKTFDAEIKAKDSLFAAVLQSYPKVGTNNDWDDLIRLTCGNERKFTVLTENLINYIVKTRDKAFAMDIFNLLSAKEEEWADAGRIYVRTLLSSEEIATTVFTRSAFNGRTKKFILKLRAYCKKYLSDGNEITLEETKVWNNYVAACKAQKRRNLIIIGATTAVLAGTGTGVFIFLNSVNESTVNINIDSGVIINMVYGDELDSYLSPYTVTYKKNSGAECCDPITLNMCSGYDLEKVGTQQILTVEFHGAKKSIPLMINYATLDVPVVTQVGSQISWGPVTYATGYNVYINATGTPYASLGEAARNYDLSAIDLFGTLSVYVRATATSGNYRNSDLSEVLSVTKLQPPTNIKYENGVLSWDAVTGADGYELTVGMNTPQTVTENSYAVSLNTGSNEIGLRAKSNTATVVEGITKTNINYLAPISGMTYTDEKIEWQVDGTPTAYLYDVYVDGGFWKNIPGANFINLKDDHDGFLAAFGNGLHEIGVVRKSNTPGVAPSDKKSFKVSVGNEVTSNGSALSWTSVGASAAYSVKINGGAPAASSAPAYLLGGYEWQTGENTVEISATLDGETVVLKTVTVTKLAAPEISVADGNWVIAENPHNMFKIDGGEWQNGLTAISELTVGTHTVKTKRGRSSDSALEIESEERTVTIEKLQKPQIKVVGGEVTFLNILNDTLEKCDAVLYYCETADGDFRTLNSLSDIIQAGTYYIKAALTGKNSSGDTVVIPSERSEAIVVTKLAAPVISYNNGDPAITTQENGVKFYYMKDGVETELEGGLISGLDGGSYTVYARKTGGDNELTSANSAPVSVFNMQITLRVQKANSTQLSFVFEGYEGETFNFSYEVKFYAKDGGALIFTATSESDVTAGKSSAASKYHTATVSFVQQLGNNSISLNAVGVVEVSVTIKSDTGNFTVPTAQYTL